ncbi:hypothetical protein CPB85DRAFT_1430142 [Mucidula mucida]|nr:hypothetical protein CPB85DRAFT_1430142 [Mucidula mucida]
MFSTSFFVLALELAGLARAGTTVWSGSFDYYATVQDFDEWSWSNQVGEYQWYIHGDGATSEYLALDASYKNPALSESTGLKLTINSGAVWNGQTMERTELIPQTVERRFGLGTMYYHFSIMRSDTNPPDSTVEHQIMFFESHFTELKYGVDSTSTDLQWMVGGASQYSVSFEAGTWYNFAYEIDFDGSTVGLWASTEGAELTKVVENVSASTSTNAADFHVGVLRLDVQDVVEDFYLSGVYIENGDITTSIGNGSNGTVGRTSATVESTTSIVQVVSSTASYAPSSSVSVSTSPVAPSASGIVSSPVSSAVVTSSVSATPSSAVGDDDECDVYITTSAPSSTLAINPVASSSAAVEDAGDDEECDVYITTSTLSPTIATGSAVTTSVAIEISSPAAGAGSSTASSSVAVSPTSTSSETIAQYGQCGGANWTGGTTCQDGWTCTNWNTYYSQCVSA